MDEKDKKKRKLIGRLLSKYAIQSGMAFIQIGEDPVPNDTNRRLQKALFELQGKLRSSDSRSKEYQKEAWDAIQKEKIERHKNESFQIEVDQLKVEFENISSQLVEAEKEIKIRIEEDNRFEMMDL